jgi:hypothetical protein
MGSYGVEIWQIWCCQKACEICGSLVQKKFATYNEIKLWMKFEDENMTKFQDEIVTDCVTMSN